MNLLFYCILAVSVVLAAKVLGVLLVSALLIIPAASAQLVTSSLASWRKLSVILSLFSVILGLAISILADLPSGPTIILTGAVIFFASVFFKR